MIMFVLPSLGKGGAQKATLTVANGVSKAGFEVEIATLKNDDVEFAISEGISVHRLNASSFSKALFPLARLLQAKNPDRIYSCLWHVNLLVILARLMIFLRSFKSFVHISSVHNNPARIIETESPFLTRFYY